MGHGNGVNVANGSPPV